jgi:hypothetical protein
MRDLSAVLSAAAVVGVMAIIGAGNPSEKVRPNIEQPVGLIEIAKKEAPLVFLSHGTGIFIAPTKFLTAQHVLTPLTEKPGELDTRIRMEDGDIYHIIGMQDSDETDVTVATVDRPYKGFVPTISCEPEKRGTELTTIGNPLSLAFIETKIMVTGGRPDTVVSQNEGNGVEEPPLKLDQVPAPPSYPGKKKKFTRIPPNEIGPKERTDGPRAPEKGELVGMEFFQGPALPGHSGSPIFNKDGYLVGTISVSVVDTGIGSFTGLGMYVPTAITCKFLADQLDLDANRRKL